MLKKKLLLLGVSTGTLEIVKYAKSNGVYVIIADNLKNEHLDIKRLADELWNVSTNDIDKLESLCRENNVAGVFAGVSEFNLDRVKELTARLGLPCYFDLSAWQVARDKSKFKYYCKQVGVPVSEDFAVNGFPTEDEINKITYPVVVKPVDKGSNCGLTFCYSKEDVYNAIKLVKAVSDKGSIIIEKKLSGIELTAFYAIAEGESSLVSLYSDLAQPGTPNYCYTLNSSVSNSLLDRYLREIDSKVKHFISTIGCRDGIVWFEIIYNEDNNFYFLEMGHRLPGDMMFMPLKDITGFNSIAWLVDYALGKKNKKEDLPESQLSSYEKCACSYYLWSNQTATICDNKDLKSLCLDEKYYIHILKDLKQEVGAFRPIAAVTFSCDSFSSLCKTIENLNTISVFNKHGEDILIHFTDFKTLEMLSGCKPNLDI